MIRQIIKIDEELCNGCGLCVNACHEAAIGIVNGKAKLLRDDYCDGLGNCLPVCPTNAISFEEREAEAYNEAEVKANMEERMKKQTMSLENQKHQHLPQCPGSMAKNNKESVVEQMEERKETPSMLRQWPVQIQLVPANAPYFQNANILIAADCSAYAYGDFHQFMKNKITLIGCPKLDDVDYSEKLTQILINNEIKSITITRMEVPCCGGIVYAVRQALAASGKVIPWRVITISTDGQLLEENY